MLINYIPQGGINPLVKALTFSGTYATATYYRQENCGVFYAEDGRVVILMRGGTSTSYENLYYVLASAPAGVTLEGQSVYNNASATAGQYYVAVLSGITKNVNISIAMDAQDATSDWVRCSITVTAI